VRTLSEVIEAVENGEENLSRRELAQLVDRELLKAEALKGGAVLDFLLDHYLALGERAARHPKAVTKVPPDVVGKHWKEGLRRHDGMVTKADAYAAQVCSELYECTLKPATVRALRRKGFRLLARS